MLYCRLMEPTGGRARIVQSYWPGGAHRLCTFIHLEIHNAAWSTWNVSVRHLMYVLLEVSRKQHALTSYESDDAASVCFYQVRPLLKGHCCVLPLDQFRQLHYSNQLTVGWLPITISPLQFDQYR